MGGNGAKNKKKSRKNHKAADAQPRRSRLTPDERRRVEDMHEILGEVWGPFKTAGGAIRGLEADAAPWLELEFWDSLAEAFLRYFGKVITLQVDMMGLERAKRAAGPLKNEDSSLPDFVSADRVTGIAGSDGQAEPAAEDRQGSHAEEGGEEVEEQGREFSDNISQTKLKMLPMAAVSHLNREGRLGIIRKTVPQERRMLVLQRLFHLAQAPPEEVALLVASVKELKNNSPSADIRDVNLLETWQGVREERASAWEHATERVRVVASGMVDPGPEAAGAATAETGGTENATNAGDASIVAAEGGAHAHGEVFDDLL